MGDPVVRYATSDGSRSLSNSNGEIEGISYLELKANINDKNRYLIASLPLVEIARSARDNNLDTPAPLL